MGRGLAFFAGGCLGVERPRYCREVNDIVIGKQAWGWRKVGVTFSRLSYCIIGSEKGLALFFAVLRCCEDGIMKMP